MTKIIQFNCSILDKNMDIKSRQAHIKRLKEINDYSSIKILWWKKMVWVLILVIIVLLLYFYSPYSTHISWKDVIIGLFSGILVFIVNCSFSYFKLFITRRRSVSNNFKKNKSFSSILDSLFPELYIRIGIIVLLASIEEYIFRSYIFSFTNAHFSLVISVLINAIIFYIVHFNSKVLELMFMGAVFAIITHYTNNMLTAIVAHAINNILVYFARRKYIVPKLKSITSVLQFKH